MPRSSGVEPKRQEFAEFYAAFKDECLRIVLVSVGDRALAEELVAEAFARAWTSWRKVRIHPVPRAWVVRTALNAHMSLWRRRRREVLLDPAALVGTHVRQADSTSVDDALVAAIRALPMRQREVIVYRVFFDMDAASTADLLGISPGTVGAHLHRALAALRTRIPAFADQEVSR